MSVAEKYRFIRPLKAKKKMSALKGFLLFVFVCGLFWTIICIGLLRYEYIG